MIFQITGYPRSGTAWLTTMFNLAPEVFAYHELAMTDFNWKETLTEMESTGQIVGDIGTYQYFPNAIIQRSKKVFIWQDPRIAQERAEKATGLKLHKETWSIWQSISGHWISECNPMVIHYQNLFRIDVLEHVWKYCVGSRDIRFPSQKVEQLIRMNIQLHEPAKDLADPEAAKRLFELL